MKNNPYDHNEKQTAKHFPVRLIDDTYIFDPVSGIYKPKTVISQQQRECEHSGHNRNARFFTDPRTDWKPIARVTIPVGLLTLALLAATVIYARRQWEAMNSTYSEIQKQTVAIQCTAQSAQKQATLLSQQMEAMQAAAINSDDGWINYNAAGKPLSVGVKVRNVGHGPAYGTTFDVIIQKEEMPSKHPLGRGQHWHENLGDIAAPSELSPSPAVRNVEHALDITEDDWNAFDGDTKTFSIKGTVNFNNGFRQRSQIVCLRLLDLPSINRRLIPCSEWDAETTRITRPSKYLPGHKYPNGSQQK